MKGRDVRTGQVICKDVDEKDVTQVIQNRRFTGDIRERQTEVCMGVRKII